MRGIDREAMWPVRAVRHPSLLIGFLFLILTGCSDSPSGPDAPASLVASSMTNSNAPFQVWHQGFEHDTEGWYGEETPGPLGWCGTVERADRRTGDHAASAGSGYAVVSQGSCNDFWAGIFGPALVNAPWAPGPDFALFSMVWPGSGLVMELDIYLDPTWTAAAPTSGVNFFAPPGTVFTYVASLRELSSTIAAPVLHYFAVPVSPDNGALSIFGHRITEAGWYTFRHVFHDDGGALSVDFELAERRGGTVFVEPIDTRFFTGLPTGDLVPTELGSGYLWFPRIADGLELPIDEHRLRQGQ